MSWFAAEAPLFPEIVALNGKWHGAKPGIVDGDRTLSWAAFDEGTNRVANGLHALGVSTVGHIPQGFPSLTLPDPGLIADLAPGGRFDGLPRLHPLPGATTRPGAGAECWRPTGSRGTESRPAPGSTPGR